MNLDLSGKRAIVCGSTQGIGKACAIELASLGASITLIARHEEKLKAVAAELPRQHQQEHHWVCADFNNPEYVRSSVTAYLGNTGEAHILVNNTGGPAAGPAHTAEVNAFVKAFEMHVLCNQVLVQAVLPYMQLAAYGRIINIISTSVKEPIQGLGVSNTIRGAVANWAKTLSKELGPYGITVNNVLPGSTDTQRIRSLVSKRAREQGKSEEEIEKAMKDEIPVGRFAEPAEIGAAVAFLASPAASFISGINLPVDGGKLNCG